MTGDRHVGGDEYACDGDEWNFNGDDGNSWVKLAIFIAMVVIVET